MNQRFDQCAECQEPLARDYGTPVVCNDCWRWLAPADRAPYVKANRNDEQSVVAAKAHATRKRPTP